MKKILLIPCSGIGKAFGSVGREAVYRVLDELRPQQTATLCLSRLTLGDLEAQARVTDCPTITVDGCPKGCARVNVEQAGATPAAALRVFDSYRAHPDCKAEGVVEIGSGGRALAGHLADEITAHVDALLADKTEEK